MPPKSKPKALKKLKKDVKKLAVKEITGRGDYRPTQFQRVRGRGDYFGDLLGGLGSKLGNWAQGKFRDITGFGDYRTRGPKRNSLVQLVDRAKDTEMQDASGVPSENPFVMGAMSVKFGGGAPRIQHREYIGPVYAPSTPASFNTTVFHIQPGLVGIGSMFPWGSSVFQNFEQYIMHGMVLEYVTCSTNYASTTALGTVSMSTVYDAESQPLASLAAVNNNEYTTSAAPSTSFYHPIECAPKDGATDVKFVRKNNSVVSGTDLRFDDVGLFQVSTSGLSCPAGTKIGDLWGSYDIEVRKAVLPDLHVGTTAQFDSAQTAATMNAVWASNTPDPQNSLPATVEQAGVAAGNATVKINMPVGYNGNYVVAYMAVTASGQFWASGAVSVNWDVAGSDVTQLAIFPTGTTAKSSGFVVGNGAAVQGNVALGIFAFSTIASTASANFIQLSITTPGSASSQKAQLLILPLDNDITDVFGMFTKFKEANPEAARLAQLMTQYQSALDNTDSLIQSHSASAIPASAAASSRAESQWEEGADESKDLEASVHIDRKQLEALLSSSSARSQLNSNRYAPSL